MGKRNHSVGNCLKCLNMLKNSIGVQRFVGDAKQTLEIRVERRGNRQGENRGEKSILINEGLFAFFLHLYYYFKEPSGLDHE